MGDVSRLLQKQHETVFFVVKSYKVWVSGGGVAYIYIYIRIYVMTYFSSCALFYKVCPGEMIRVSGGASG